MTFPTVGPASATTGNVAGGPYAAWSGTIQASVIGPAGSLVPLAQFGALYDGTNSISSGTAVFSDANGVSFGFNGQTITASAFGGVQIDAIGNTTGTTTALSTGTLYLAGGPNVTLSQNGNSISISAGTAAAANLSVSAGTTSGNFGGLTFSNGSGVSWGLNNGTITASVAAQSVQTQASGNIAATGFATTTTNGVVIVGTNNTTGLTLAVPAYITTYVAQTVQTQASGNIAATGFATTTTNGSVILGTNNTTGFTLAVPPYLTTAMASNGGSNFVGLNTAETNVTWTVNSSGVSLNAAGYAGTGTTFGGTNVSATMTLNSAGLVLSLSGGAGGGGGAAISAAGSSQNAGTIVFSNSNNVSFGMNGSTITASASGGAGGIAASAAGSSQSAGTIVWSNSNNVSFGMNGSTITASITQSVQTQASGNIAATGFATTTTNGSVIVGTNNTTGLTLAVPPYLTTAMASNAGSNFVGLNTAATNVTWTVNSSGVSLNASGYAGLGTTFAGANISGSMTVNSAGLDISLSVGSAGGSTGAIYFDGNTTGQSTQSTYTLASLNVSGAGLVSAGWSSNSLIISGPGTTALQAITAVADSANTQTTGMISFANSNGITFGISTDAATATITASFSGGGGATSGGWYATGNTTNNSTTTLPISSVLFNALGAQTVGFSNGSIQLSVPATSSLVGVNNISVSTNGSTISISNLPASVYVPYYPASTGGMSLVGALATASGSAYFFPFQVEPPGIAFNALHIAGSFSNTASVATAFQWSGVLQFGLYSQNASQWSLISSNSLSMLITSSGASGTLSYPSSTNTAGYTYTTTAVTTTAQAASYWGQSYTRDIGLVFGASMSLSPGLFALGLLSTNASASHAGGQTGYICGNIWGSNSLGVALIGVPPNATSWAPIGAMGAGTASTGSLPAGIAWTNMSNTVSIMPWMSFVST